MSRGAGCSKEGKLYENIIYNIVSKCELNNIKFNTQTENELGGCNSRNDIECNLLTKNDIPIEIKKMNTPDWMQCSLKYDESTNRWHGSTKNKIPEKCKLLFEELLNNTELFNGKIPPFMLRDITHAEWVAIKKETQDYNDSYLHCSNDTIERLYREKGCRYIQISGKGLYHLGEDVCGFNVPEFICEQQLRIRTKIHTRENSRGFCSLSVTCACQPKNIKNLIESKYSLDNIESLPKNIVYVRE